MLSTTTLHDHATVEYVINALETETNYLLKQLDCIDLSFLEEYPVFQEDPRGRPKVHHAPKLLRG